MFQQHGPAGRKLPTSLHIVPAGMLCWSRWGAESLLHPPTYPAHPHLPVYSVYLSRPSTSCSASVPMPEPLKKGACHHTARPGTRGGGGAAPMRRSSKWRLARSARGFQAGVSEPGEA